MVITSKYKYGKYRVKQIFGWLGTITLLLIIPIKLFRFGQTGDTTKLIIGIAPSLLGPAGLLFLILSSSGKWLNRSLVQSTFLVFFTALSLEFIQLLPGPGFLKYIHYTFDWFDVLSSIISLSVAYIIAKIILNYFSNKF